MTRADYITAGGNLAVAVAIVFGLAFVIWYFEKKTR